MRVLYFAQLQELTGRAEDTFDASIGSIAELITQVRARYPKISSLNLFAAVNQTYAAPACAIQATDEIALFPQVTGG